MSSLKLLNKAALRDIQGIIISGYGHLPYAGYLFLTLSDTAKARDWLLLIIPRITVAQRPEGAGDKKRPEYAINIAFTNAGIEKFNLPFVSGFSEEFTEGIAEEHRARRLGDDGNSAPELWEIKEKDIHLLLMVQAPTADLLKELSDELTKQYQQYGITEGAPSQHGFQPADNKEHFGFTDSISQPFIENSPANPRGQQSCVRAGEFILGYHNEYNLIPPTPTLKAEDDLHGNLPALYFDHKLKDFGQNGTYLVFRKLYQDVAKFHAYLDANTRDQAHRDLVAAKFVGRWPSGTPLVMSPEADNPDVKDKNAFFYMNNDAQGLKCPYGAHIRRVNPRDSLGSDPIQSLKTVNHHRILRRGIQYGERLSGTRDDGADRGILFLCLNADIRRQFEFMQQSWINNPKFADLYNDRDPITGNNKDLADDTREYDMTIPSIPVREKFKGMPRFVHVKGGAYFFLPGIAALYCLAGAKKPD